MDDSATAPTSRAIAAPEDPNLGKVIGERYRLLGRIGEGGMGLVYRAEHTLMKKTVAIKLLHGELGQLNEAVKRFEREAQSASRLNHPNIIHVTDFGRAATGEFFLVMEYVAGHSLGHTLATEPAQRMSVARALTVVRQMLSALGHAHAQGVVHRDLKPANVMLTRSVDGRSEDVVKILDFGIAKMTQASADAGGSGEHGLTQSSMVFGTPSYMSPEQATAQDVDARADLYSCGVILYELCTGRKPFVADDLARVLAMQVTAPPPPFATAAPGVRLPAALEDVVMRALEKDRARRFQSAEQFLAALDSLEITVVPQALAALAADRGRVALSHGRALMSELRARYGRLPPETRRWTPLVGVAGVVLALVVVPTLCYRAVNLGKPPPPRPVAAAVEAPLQKVDEAMAKGQLQEARAMLLQLLSKHPKEARVHFQVGNLEYVERKFTSALSAYDEALRLDPGLRGDAALLSNVRSLVVERDKKVALAALDLAAERIGAPAADLLVETANEDARAELRAAARSACTKIDCDERVDLVKSYGQDLVQGRTCEERREAIRRLGATRELRAAEVLRKARGVKGALGGLFGGGNDCVRKDIDAALKELEGN